MSENGTKFDEAEPLAAILAEMRDRAGDALDSGYTGEARDMLSLADRIEAAAEREREIARDLGRIDRESDNMASAADALEKAFAPGNTAAMREAVERAIDAIQTMIALYDEEHTSAVQIGATWKRSDTSVVNAIVEQARAALAAPPEPPSNAAAMRVALKDIRFILRRCVDEGGYCTEEFANLAKWADAALASSARNCDRFATADEARDAVKAAFANTMLLDDRQLRAVCDWLFDSAEGGAEC